MNKTLKIILITASILFMFVVGFYLINTYLISSRQVEAVPDQGLTIISSQEATEIALDYIGHGSSHHVTLVNENGVDIYEVQIIDDEIRYLVYVSAENGHIVRMMRFEEGYEGITTLPEIIPPDDLDAVSDE